MRDTIPFASTNMEGHTTGMEVSERSILEVILLEILSQYHGAGVLEKWS